MDEVEVMFHDMPLVMAIAAVYAHRPPRRASS